MAKSRTSYKKGQSGNLKGRPPKGHSITEWFKAMLNSNPEIKDKLGSAILDKALKGDPSAQKLVWQYMDGLPKQDIGMDVKGKIDIDVKAAIKKIYGSKAKNG